MPDQPPPPPGQEGSIQAGYTDEAGLAVAMGRFLRACPGLSKQTIGELLGEPDQFYLQVLKGAFYNSS